MLEKTILVLFLSLSVSAMANAYNPPTGIPDPGSTWGAIHPIDAPSPDAATYAPGWFKGTPRANSISTGDAHDCYYIDNSAVGATDASNTFGYPGHPRLTIPNIAYSAGSYVEIHGDGATEIYKYGETLTPRGAGTATDPIWFVGINKPILSGTFDFGSTNSARNAYMIFDGLYWRDGAKLDLRPRFTGNTIDHICLRNCDIKGTSSSPDATGVAIGAAVLGDPTETVQDVILYNCQIYNFGDKNNPGEECGVNPKFYVTRLWVLDSEIHDMAEDGFGGSHGGQQSSSYFYIGRNQIHDNLTNAIDIKQYGTGVIISENTMWGQHDVWVNGVHKSSGIGETIVLHYSGDSTGSGSFRNYPADVSVLCNTIYDGRYGISTSQVSRLRIVGNIIYQMHYGDGPTGSALPYAINLRGIRGDTWIANNTIYSSDGGISIGDDPAAYSPGTIYYKGLSVSYAGASYICTDDNNDSGLKGVAPSNSAHWNRFRVQLWGNIVAARNVQTQGDLTFFGSNFGNNSVDEDYNLFYNSKWGESIIYGGATVHDLLWMKANTTHEAHGKNTNPLLSNIKGIDDSVNVATDFTLSEGSPAIDASTEGTGTTAYADFSALYGLSIKWARKGISRPVNDKWDIGANEFSSGVLPPGAPQNLKVLP